MTRSFYVYVLGLLSAMLLCVGSLSAATGTLMPSPWFYALDTNGNPISLAKACFYTAGTSTPATTYSDVLLTTPNANPLRGDTSGRVGPIYLVPGQSYKLILQDSTGTAGNCDGAVVRSQDNIAAVPASAASVDITATAGEAITAGQCVYWSDGSGSKTPGLVYKCDAANTYSSTTNEVGIATAAISSGSSGNIRTSGQVTGLSVSAGSEYFAGTAGALTTTAPANRRHVGHADSATTLILTGNPPPLVPLGTSGGIPYYSSTTTLASSAALAANALVIGGGAGVTPATNSGFTINSTSFLSSSTQARAVLTNSAVQSIPDSTGTVLTFDTEEVDVGGTHSTSSNTGRFTVPTSGDGFYCFFGYMSWAGAATNQRQFSLRKNGTTTYVLDNRSGSASINVSHAVTSCHALVATDYMELIAYQDSGGAINTGTNTRFIGVKLW